MSDVRPINDWVLVKMDDLPEQRGGILLTVDSSANTVRTATVLKVGKGKRTGEGYYRHPGVKPGEKVAFFRWHQEHKPGKQLAAYMAEVGDDLGLLKAEDILFAYDATDNIEVTT